MYVFHIDRIEKIIKPAEVGLFATMTAAVPVVPLAAIETAPLRCPVSGRGAMALLLAGFNTEPTVVLLASP